MTRTSTLSWHSFSRQLSHLFLQAGLFPAAGSAFVIGVHSNLQPDPNDQSAALLRALLLTLNQSAMSGETPIVPPVQEDPPSEKWPLDFFVENLPVMV